MTLVEFKRIYHVLFAFQNEVPDKVADLTYDLRTVTEALHPITKITKWAAAFHKIVPKAIRPSNLPTLVALAERITEKTAELRSLTIELSGLLRQYEKAVDAMKDSMWQAWEQVERANDLDTASWR